VNVARELMQQVGIHEDQVTQVRGFADQRLRIKQNAMDPGKPENFADRAGFGKAFE
jgi:flagellar motor protein MotB